MNKITYDTWDKENSNVEILVSKRINEQDLPNKIKDLKKFRVITDNIINSDKCSITNSDVPRIS
ncbi:hypothetical protein ACMC56_11780 [Campylobacterota bacterium DY0563]